jgi:hypothetical protein
MGLIIYIISAFVIVLTTLSLLSSLFPLQANASVVLPNQDEEEQEIFLTLYDNSTFMPLTSGEGNQVSVFVNYEVHDDSIAGQRINAVMEVFAPNGTLIKTSSYPDGFIAQSSGGVEGLETTLKDKSIQSVTANVRFTDAAKIQIISNNISANLDLKGQITTTTGTTGGGGQGGAEGEDEGTFEAEGEEATAEEMTPQPPSQGDGGTSENTDEDEEEDGVEAESEAEEETSLDIPSSFG